MSAPLIAITRRLDIFAKNFAYLESALVPHDPNPKGGKTIGMIIPPDLRVQIEAIRDKHHLRSYAHATMACIKAGALLLK